MQTKTKVWLAWALVAIPAALVCAYVDWRVAVAMFCLHFGENALRKYFPPDL